MLTDEVGLVSQAPVPVPEPVLVPVLTGQSAVALAVRRLPDPAGSGQLPVDLDDGVLSAQERRRSAAMSAGRAVEFISGRVLLRQLVAGVLGISAVEVPLRIDARGALRLGELPAGVSLSHSLQHVAAAFCAGGRVGVDIEEPRIDLDDRLLLRCFRPEDSGLVQLPAPRRAAAFARVWTAQEACAKALGLGLASRPWTIPVDPEQPCGHWRNLTWARVNTFEPGAALTVAVRNPRDDAKDGNRR